MEKQIVIVGSTHQENIKTALAAIAQAHAGNEESVRVLVMSEASLNAHMTLASQEKKQLSEEELAFKQAEEFLSDSANRERVLGYVVQLQDLIVKGTWFNINDIYKKTKLGMSEVKRMIQEIELFGFLQRDTINHNKVMFTVSKEDRIKYYLTQYINTLLIATDIEGKINQESSDGYPEGLPTIQEINESNLATKRGYQEALNIAEDLEKQGLGKANIILH